MTTSAAALIAAKKAEDGEQLKLREERAVLERELVHLRTGKDHRVGLVVPRMRAIGVTEFGGTLQVLDLPEPHAGPGEVRIRVHAAAVNPTDTGVLSGRYADRYTAPGPYIPGADAAEVLGAVRNAKDSFRS